MVHSTDAGGLREQFAGFFYSSRQPPRSGQVTISSSVCRRHIGEVVHRTGGVEKSRLKVEIIFYNLLCVFFNPFPLRGLPLYYIIYVYATDCTTDCKK